MSEMLLQQIAASLQHIEQLLQQTPEKLQQQNSSNGAANDGMSLGSKTKPRAKPKNLNYKDYPAFAAFWLQYPNRRGKYAAFCRWHQLAANDEMLQQQIIDGAKAYANDPTRDPDHTKHAEGWLNDRRWEDEYKVSRPAPVEDVEFFDMEKYLREQTV